MINKYKYLSFCILLITGFITAQDTIQLTKTELLFKAKEQNLQVLLAQKEKQSAEADVLKSKGVFMPQVRASYTFMTTTNALGAFGSKLNQEILKQSDFNPALLNDPGNIQDFATKVEVLQPIFNWDGNFERKAAKTKVEALDFQTERTTEYVELEISKAYLQLQMAYNVVNTLSEAKNTALANQKLVENYYNNGLLQKTELLNVQVRVTEIDNQLQYAKSNVQNASDYIFFLMNEPSDGKVIHPTEELVYNESLTDSNITLREDRKDILAYDKSIEAYENMAISKKKKIFPRLNAFGTFEIHDKDLMQFHGEGYTVGLQLSWDIFNGYQNIADKQKSAIELEKAKTEKAHYVAQSQLELNKTNRQLQDAVNKINLTKLTVEQSKEAYRIRKNRFEQGLEKTTDLLNAETQMSQKKLEYLQAIFEYNTTHEYLKFLTK